MVRNLKKSRKSLVIGLVVLLCAAGVLYYFTAHQSNTKNPVKQSNPKATIKKLPSQSTSNNGEKTVAGSSTNNQGNATDNHGVISGTTASTPVQSQSGVITVTQPASGATIKSGAALSGSASVNQVQYRLIDDQVGVISQGFISVVGGKFSASINFQSHGSTGRLDVFSSNSAGAEINEVQLPVRF